MSAGKAPALSPSPLSCGKDRKRLKDSRAEKDTEQKRGEEENK